MGGPESLLGEEEGGHSWTEGLPPPRGFPLPGPPWAAPDGLERAHRGLHSREMTTMPQLCHAAAVLAPVPAVPISFSLGPSLARLLSLASPARGGRALPPVTGPLCTVASLGMVAAASSSCREGRWLWWRKEYLGRACVCGKGPSSGALCPSASVCQMQFP